MAQRISIGFQASPPLALRVSDERARPASTTPSAARAGTRSRPRTARCGSTSPTSSGCAPRATSTASASASPRRASGPRAPDGIRRHGRDERAHAARRALSPRRPGAAGRPGALRAAARPLQRHAATTSRTSARRCCASCSAASARGSWSSPPSAATTVRTSASATARSSTSTASCSTSRRSRSASSCWLATQVQLLAATHPIDPGPRRDGWEYGAPITIADNVWLGGGVIVCPGVTIGEDTVVGAGAVVTRDLPAGVVAYGNPARVVREIGERDRVQRAVSAARRAPTCACSAPCAPRRGRRVERPRAGASRAWASTPRCGSRMGLLGALVDRPRRAPLEARGARGRPRPTRSTRRIKARRAPPPAGGRRPARAHGDADRSSASRPRTPRRRSPPRAPTAPAARPRRSTPRPRAMAASRRLPRRALPDRHRRRARCSALAWGARRDEGRDRRACPTPASRRSSTR